MILAPRHLIDRAHMLGLHQDGYFHPECPTCLTEAFVAYRGICRRILTAAGEAIRIPEFDTFILELHSDDLTAMMFHNEPASLVAEFLGEPVGGDEDWEKNPTWQRIHQVLPQVQTSA